MNESNLTGQIAAFALQVVLPIAAAIIAWFVQDKVRKLEEQLRECRADLKELRNRDDEIKDSLAHKMDDLRDRVDEKLEAMRHDINGGLGAIRDQLARLKA